MKIIIKTLKGQQLPLEVEEDLKVGFSSQLKHTGRIRSIKEINLLYMQISDLKQKIDEEHKMPAESQKLIAYGKVMDNPDSTLKDYKIADGGFIVVMMQKVSK